VDKAEDNAAVNASAGRPALEFWFAPPARPRESTVPSIVLTTQRVVVAPASTPMTKGIGTSTTVLH
jgi:hypothetical protein